MDFIQQLERAELKKLADKDIPEFRPGDTVKVHVKVIEGDKERIQVFEGICIDRAHGGLRESFTVRKISGGIGVERNFPLHSPIVSKIQVVRKGKVSRSRLYYLRDRIGRKATKVKEQALGKKKKAAKKPAAKSAPKAEAKSE